jgi:hypothetical protein
MPLRPRKLEALNSVQQGRSSLRALLRGRRIEDAIERVPHEVVNLLGQRGRHASNPVPPLREASKQVSKDGIAGVPGIDGLRPAPRREIVELGRRDGDYSACRKGAQVFHSVILPSVAHPRRSPLLVPSMSVTVAYGKVGAHSDDRPAGPAIAEA